MIALTTTVFNWYSQRRSPRLFSGALNKSRRVSIHEIINSNAEINGAKGPTKADHDWSNTIALLYMVRRRKAYLGPYLQGVSMTHRKTADRLLRGMNRSKSRAKK